MKLRRLKGQSDEDGCDNVDFYDASTEGDPCVKLDVGDRVSIRFETKAVLQLRDWLNAWTRAHEVEE